MAVAAQNPDVCRVFTPDPAALSVGVVCDERFARHLQGVFHMESSKRCEAIQIRAPGPRLCGPNPSGGAAAGHRRELAWVHTPDYIARVAATAGQPLTSMDVDTQTTADSYDTARLAVGAVFSLLDAIQAGRVKRGFAAVRPPGHHAEPGRGMGFCIFNNVALGARYLQRALRGQARHGGGHRRPPRQRHPSGLLRDRRGAGPLDLTSSRGSRAQAGWARSAPAGARATR
jgi:hypothetical protein